MEAVFYDLGGLQGRDDYLEVCIPDPLSDPLGDGGLWPLLQDVPPSQASALTQLPCVSKNAVSSTTESQDESALVLETASLPETRGSVPDVSSSEASHAGVSERAGTPAASCRKRNSEDLYSPRQKAHIKKQRDQRGSEHRIDSLVQACSALQARNRLLEHIVHSACSFSTEARQNKALETQMHEGLLRGMMAVYAGALSWPELVSPAILGVVTMDIFVSGIFPNYLECLRKLLEDGGWDASSSAGLKLAHLVHQRRKAEDCLGLFSEWGTTLLAWNQGEATTLSKPPSAAFHASLLEGLRLGPAQVQELVAARRRLLACLLTVQTRREDAILAMGLALLQQAPSSGQAGGPSSASVPLAQIQQSLEDERMAVATFLNTCIDQVLTPAQEAWLDCQCQPWSPDLWLLAGLLAEAQPGEPSRAAEASLLSTNAREPGRGSERDRAKGVALEMGAFGLLRAPLLGRGAGLALKRLVTLQPLPCLGKASCGQGSDRPLSLLRHTKLLDALAGRACGPTRTPPGAARDNPAAKTLDQCLCRLAPPARAPAAIKGL